MGFLEIVGAAAIGSTVPVVLARYLDARARRRQSDALSQTGLGRYMQWVMSRLDREAGDLANSLTSSADTD